MGSWLRRNGEAIHAATEKSGDTDLSSDDALELWERRLAERLDRRFEERMEKERDLWKERLDRALALAVVASLPAEARAATETKLAIVPLIGVDAAVRLGANEGRTPQVVLEACSGRDLPVVFTGHD